MVESEWMSLNCFYLELDNQLEAAEYDDKAVQEAVQFDLSSKIKEKGDVVMELRRLAEFQKVKKLDSSSKEVVTVASKEGGSALKLKGLTAPTFTGKAEDFASWKERFLALVLKGRSKEEVAALLELSIPSKKVYLLRECKQDDYEGMLDILQRELAPTRDVINNVKLQLTKLKKITAEDKDGDRKFISMVEELEKISRDLKAINELSVLANSSTLDDVERKLPPVVLTWWRRDKHENKFYEKTDIQKFEDLMQFLKNSKMWAKEGVADLENAKANSSKTYTCFVSSQTFNTVVKNKSDKKDSTNKKDQIFFCKACGRDGATDQRVTNHKMSTCSVWWSLSVEERKKLLACEHHPYQNIHTTSSCQTKKPKFSCLYCKSPRHHFLVCVTHKAGFLTRLQTFTVRDPSSIKKNSVLLPLTWVEAGNSGAKLVKCGTLLDSCSCFQVERWGSAVA